LDTQCGVRREGSLASPNQIALVSSANFAPLSEVKDVSPSADNVAYTASPLRVLTKSLTKGTNKVPNYKVRTKVLCSANYIRHNVIIKAPLRAKSEATTASLPALFLVLSSHLEVELNV